MGLVKKGVKKVNFFGDVVVDHAGATVDESTLANGVRAWNSAGDLIEGENTNDADTRDGNLTPSMVVNGGIGYSQGSRVVGNVPTKNGVNLEINSATDELTIPYGLHDGSGKAKLSANAIASIDADVILQGNNILGIDGKYVPADCKAQAKTVSPAKTQQVVRPDAGYTHLTTVTVNGVSYVETTDSDGGKIVTIG